VLIQNTDEILNRRYQSLLTRATFRLSDRWTAEAHWTHQIKNEGNFEGEAANQPGSYSIIFDRPEILDEARHFPTGRTDDFQADKVRLYTVYDLRLGRAGTVSVGGVYRYDSPQTYSLSAAGVAISTVQRDRRLALGYARQPASQTLFFSGRGEFEYEASHLFDFSLNYELPIYKSARPFFKAELRNAFNKQPLIGFNTTISPVTAGPLDTLGLPTTFTNGALFGTPTNDQNAAFAHVPVPREFRVSVGFRF
jgi:hypothetical protein